LGGLVEAIEKRSVKRRTMSRMGGKGQGKLEARSSKIQFLLRMSIVGASMC
jgi:hypothetical protein